MRREYDNITTETFDDLSVVFHKINTQYQNKPKMLINNHSNDDYIYIVVYPSTANTAKNATLLICDRTDILTTHSLTFQHAVPMTNRYAAIDNMVCIPDSSQNTGYKLRIFKYNPVTNSVSESTISSGANYLSPLGACYYEQSTGNPHFVCIYNSTYNTPGDYDLITNTYTRQNQNAHRYIHFLSNNYQGVSNRKLLITGEYNNSNYYTCKLAETFTTMGVSTSNYQRISPVYYSTGNNKQFMVGRRYNNPELFRVFMYVSGSNWSSKNVCELTFNSDYTTLATNIELLCLGV